MEIGDYLIKARKTKGLSQEEVANKLNVSRQSVSLWETNQTYPTIENLMSLSKLYDVSVSYLMGQEDIDSIDALAKEKKHQELLIKQQQEREAEINNKKEHVYKQDSKQALILTIVLMCLFFVPGLSIILAIVAIVMSFNAFRERKNNINLFSLVFSSVFLFAAIFASIEKLYSILWGNLI